MIGLLERFLSRAGRLGLHPPERAAEQLHRYVNLLLDEGEKLALLSKRDLSAERIVGRHFSDALDALLLARPPSGAAVLDFGSGGGVVGITWSVLRPDLKMTLLESRHRKATFLGRAIEALALENVGVREGRAMDLAKSEPAPFDLAASRGVATTRKTIAAVHCLLHPRGRALFFKGPDSAPATTKLLQQDGRFALEEEKITLLGEGKRRVFLLVRRAE